MTSTVSITVKKKTLILRGSTLWYSGLCRSKEEKNFDTFVLGVTWWATGASLYALLYLVGHGRISVCTLFCQAHDARRTAHMKRVATGASPVATADAPM